MPGLEFSLAGVLSGQLRAEWPPGPCDAGAAAVPPGPAAEEPHLEGEKDPAVRHVVEVRAEAREEL